MNATFHEVYLYDDGRQLMTICETLVLTPAEVRAYLCFLLGV